MQKVVKELAEAIGIGDAIEVCRRWGGRDLNVPRTVQLGDPLALTLGFDSAKRLVAAFGGEKLQLPAERNALLDMRNAAIVRDLKAGQSRAAVGLAYGLTRQGVKQVWLRHLKEVTGDDPQPLAAESRNP